MSTDQTPEPPLTHDELAVWAEHRACADCDDSGLMARELIAARAEIAALKLRLEPVGSPNFEALLRDLGIDMTDPQEVLAEKVVQQRERIRELKAAVIDEEGAHRVAAEAADRFRDVVAEAVGTPDWNPGDDELVRRLRALHGHDGPEPRRWRDFVTGAVAHLENNGRRWASDAVLNEEDPHA